MSRAIGNGEVTSLRAVAASPSPIGSPTVLYNPGSCPSEMGKGIVPSHNQYCVVGVPTVRVIEGVGAIIVGEFALPGRIVPIASVDGRIYWSIGVDVVL